MDVTVPTREIDEGEGPRIGALFAGRYQIESKLGAGGFGAVYAARDRQLERDVAVKVLGAAGDALALARFLQEAKTIAALDSEHVVTLHEVAVAGRAPYIVMERLRGVDLGALLRDRRALPIEMALDYMLQAALGVAHAHGREIVHRDLKPRNLFLAERADGTRLVKVLDFGVAKAQTSELTESGAAIGTTRYMAPEQLRSSRTVDARTDIWALGAVLYELISGTPIFDGGSAAETGVAILTDPHVPLRERVPDVSSGLSATIDRCLAKDPRDRHASVLQLACALGATDKMLARFERALGGQAGRIGIPTVPDGERPPIRRAGSDAATKDECRDAATGEGRDRERNSAARERDGRRVGATHDGRDGPDDRDDRHHGGAARTRDARRDAATDGRDDNDRDGNDRDREGPRDAATRDGRDRGSRDGRRDAARRTDRDGRDRDRQDHDGAETRATDDHDRAMARMRWLVVGAIVLGLGGVGFGIAMALRSPAVERVVIHADAATPAIPVASADAAFAAGPDPTGAAPDAALAASDAAVVAGPAITPDAGVRATPPVRPPPKQTATPPAELELIQKQCNYERTTAPWFLIPGQSGGAYGCRQIALLGCAGVAAACAKMAITDDEKQTCRDFLFKIRGRGCP